MTAQCKPRPDAAGERPPRAPRTEFRRDGQYCLILPARPELGRLFYTVRHATVPDESGGARLSPLCYPLVWDDENNQGRRYSSCFAGLEPIIEAYLVDQGHRVRRTGARPAELKPPILLLSASSKPVDEGVLGLIARADRGLIRHDPGHVDPAWLIAQVAVAWPRVKIVVAATHLDDAHELHRRLCNHIPRAGLYTSRRRDGHFARVAVATYSYLRTGPIGLERRGILFATDPAGLFDGHDGAGRDAIGRAWAARAYGLLAEGAQLPPHTRDLVAAFFGPDVVHVPRHGHVRRPVRVAFARIAGGPPAPATRDELAVKREGLWGHPVRNRRLARLFTSLVAGELDRAYAELGGPAGLAPRDLAGRPVLLVEGVEHALDLARRLPGVPIVADAGAIWAEGLSPAQRDLLGVDGGRHDHPGPVIATSAGLARVGRFDILVRADGGTALPALPPAHLLAPAGRENPLVLIDVDDRHHPVLRRRSRARRQAYVARGWPVAGQPPESPLEAFLAGRPEVRS